MKKPVFILDENIDARFASYLRKKGFIVKSCSKGISDEKLLEFTIKTRGILVTNDNDFSNSDRYLPRDHSYGIIVFSIHPRLLAQLTSCFEQMLLSVSLDTAYGSIIIATPKGITILNAKKRRKK